MHFVCFFDLFHPGFDEQAKLVRLYCLAAYSPCDQIIKPKDVDYVGFRSPPHFDAYAGSRKRIVRKILANATFADALADLMLLLVFHNQVIPQAFFHL